VHTNGRWVVSIQFYVVEKPEKLTSHAKEKNKVIMSPEEVDDG